MTLDKQLVFAELTGNKSKARLIRSSLIAFNLRKIQEQKDLEKFKCKDQNAIF